MAVDVVIVNNCNDDVVITFFLAISCHLVFALLLFFSKIVNNIDTTTIATIKTSAPFL